mmetsp:Transcript_93617/g.217647  ORF Transcript_93617/g.217647 Transcript_93617/m.217647 type:complete len:89 (+) Transcript_93617:192-458(+)
MESTEELRLEEGCLELPGFAGDLQSHTCDVCNQRFDGRLLLMQHQVDHGHFNSRSDAELAKLRSRDASAVTSAIGRLEAALGGHRGRC